MNSNERPDYSIKYYTHQSFNRKRQIIDAVLAEMHEMQMNMIEEALAMSDMQQAKDIIKCIMERS
jgi:hypothetical protein